MIAASRLAARPGDSKLLLPLLLLLPSDTRSCTQAHQKNNLPISPANKLICRYDQTADRPHRQGRKEGTRRGVGGFEVQRQVKGGVDGGGGWPARAAQFCGGSCLKPCELEDILQIKVLDRMGEARDIDHWAPAEVPRKELHVEGGRHQDQAEVWVLWEEVSEGDQHKIREPVPLMDLINDDVGDA